MLWQRFCDSNWQWPRWIVPLSRLLLPRGGRFDPETKEIGCPNMMEVHLS